MSDVNAAAATQASRFWKISHGKAAVLANRDHAWLMENHYVAIGYAPDDKEGKGQGQKFAGIRQGDYLYLVRNQNIVLFGRFTTSQAEPVSPQLPTLSGWWARPIEVIRNISATPYPSSHIHGGDGWKPMANTTVAVVPDDQLTQFAATILKPAFDLDLMELNTSGKQAASVRADSAPLNSILYGPPGTGKTFHTVTHAVRIIDGTPAPETDAQYQEQKIRFDALRREGRIAFITFHQSFSYEDFIEGIRAEAADGQLRYEIKDGIFKQMAIAAMYSKLRGQPSGMQAPGEINFGDLFSAFMAWIEDNPDVSMTSATGKKLSFKPTSSEDTLYVSHGASEKRHPAGRERLSKLYKKYPSLSAMDTLKNKDIITEIGGANTTAYWAVLKALLKYKEEHLPDLKAAREELAPEANIDYKEKKARVREADASDFGAGLPYVLIIDEINRGNTSRVFGELITLIEDTKRAGGSEQAEVILPYSNDSFSVPDNLYLIGTMNTADRSLATIDTALRRRFDFTEMMPDPDQLSSNVSGVDLKAMLRAMNDRIEQLYDREHTIGHAFFMRLDANSKVGDLARIFNNKILPLLEEYFFEDWEKIANVLGKATIYTIKTSVHLGFEAKNKVYRRDAAALLDPQTYRRIYQ
ncbi:AAA family ATPase [Massilia sp. CCM 9210]|uniref:McrB family protein n=1 Tax=Massilia scottii TaxID=3057166 RepID=UPI0027967EA9|nr:AAA family ATPase [Massilia sp. CCM 9210]MDQ1816333.1 AAA family ATPase [Massilia sp. CCM 9210]